MLIKASDDQRASSTCHNVSLLLVRYCSALIALLLIFPLIPSALVTAKGNIVEQSIAKKYSLIGPKNYYLALGDSLALGYQPDFDLDDGYASDFFQYLKNSGVKDIADLGCYGESSFTFINYGCPAPFLRKYPYLGPQLTAALTYLHQHLGQVSPITLDIGANDLVQDIDFGTCTISSNFNADLQNLDKNLTQTILPQLYAALTISGKQTGDIVMMNYYDPFQNKCPNTLSYFQTLNKHLTNDVHDFGIIVDIFTAFGGLETPNQYICTYTWMCSIFSDYHPTDEGYKVIYSALKQSTKY